MRDEREPDSPAAPRKALFEEFGRFKAFAPGEEIISAGDERDDIYFILDGEVKVTNLSSNGKDIWHNVLGAGTTFGEMAALTGRTRNASIVAVRATRVAVVSRAEMMVLLKSDPSIAIWLLTEMAERLQQANEMIRSLVAQSLSQRIRAELARLATPLTDEPEKLAIEPAPNLSEMARRLNTDRENVSREVSALTARGVLRKETDRLVILDPEFLRSTSAL
jgi:CRP-like cAMP-binding protein